MTQHVCRYCLKTFVARQAARTYCSLYCSDRGRVGGPKAPNGAGYIDCHGYKFIYVNGKRMREHRAVMTTTLGRALERGEVVHHKDGDKLNNAPNNLEVMENLSSHSKEHMRGRIVKTSTHKECSRCHGVKPRSQFAPANRKDGDTSQAYCHSCMAEYMRMRRVKRQLLASSSV